MKKISLVIISIAFVFLISSCASSSSPFMPEADGPTTAAADKNLLNSLPSWVITDPSDDDFIYTYGYGKGDTREVAIAFARSEALNKLAEQVSLVVDGVTDDVITAERTAAETTSVRNLTNEIKTQSHAVINGARQTNLYLVTDTEVYVQYGVRVENLENQVLALIDNLVNALSTDDPIYNTASYDSNLSLLDTIKQAIGKNLR